MPGMNQTVFPSIDNAKIIRAPSHTSVFINILLTCSFIILMGCTPTVKVEAPPEPITINLNIKLDADIRVKLEEDAKKDIAANPGIF